MNTFRTTLSISIAMIALAFIARAEEKTTPAAAGFDRIKSLAGEWDVTAKSGEHAGPAGTVTYKLTAAGSAVQESLMAGTDHEMLTVYHLAGDNLVLTHYCMLHNQPHMRAQPGATADKIVFKCTEGENAKVESETHMHQVTYTFVDADHVKTDWVLYKDGKPDSTHSFELVRKKK